MIEAAQSFEKITTDLTSTLSSTPKPLQLSFLISTCRSCGENIFLCPENQKSFGSPCLCTQPSKYIHKKCLENYVNSNIDCLQKRSKSQIYSMVCDRCGDSLILTLKKRTCSFLNKDEILNNIWQDLAIFILFTALNLLLVIAQVLIILSFVTEQALPEFLSQILAILLFILPCGFFCTVRTVLKEYFLMASYQVADFKEKRVINTIEEI